MISGDYRICLWNCRMACVRFARLALSPAFSLAIRPFSRAWAGSMAASRG